MADWSLDGIKKSVGSAYEGAKTGAQGMAASAAATTGFIDENEKAMFDSIKQWAKAGLADDNKAGSFLNELRSHRDEFLPAKKPGEKLSPEDLKRAAGYRGFVTEMARQWEKNPAFVDNLAVQAKQVRGFQQAVQNKKFDGVDLAAYAKNPTLEGLRAQVAVANAPVVDPAAAERERQARAQAQERAKLAAAEKARLAAGKDHDTPPGRAKAGVQHHDTIKPTAPGRPSLAETTAEPAAKTAASVPVSSSPMSGSGFFNEDLAVTGIQKIVSQMGEIFSSDEKDANGDRIREFGSEESTLLERMENNPALRQKIVDAFNKDPKLKEMMEGGGDDLLKKYNDLKDDPKTQESVRNALRPFYKDFLKNPEKIADADFRKQMEDGALSAGTTSKINGFLQGFLGKDFDISTSLGGLGSSLMSFIKPLLDMFKDLFKGISAGGGVGNFLTMGNGGGMFGNLMANVSTAMDTGARYSAQERMIERDIGVRAVDRNHDGKFSDGLVFDVQGKAVMERVKDAKGQDVQNEDGTYVMKQKYDEKLDDRKLVNGERVFELSGTSETKGPNGGVLRAYAERVNEKTGQLMPGSAKIIEAANGTSTTKSADNDNDTVQPVVVTPPKTPALAANDPNANNIPSFGTGPGGVPL